jgi:hypothetical protein
MHMTASELCMQELLRNSRSLRDPSLVTEWLALPGMGGLVNGLDEKSSRAVQIRRSIRAQVRALRHVAVVILTVALDGTLMTKCHRSIDINGTTPKRTNLYM